MRVRVRVRVRVRFRVGVRVRVRVRVRWVNVETCPEDRFETFSCDSS